MAERVARALVVVLTLVAGCGTRYADRSPVYTGVSSDTIAWLKQHATPWLSDTQLLELNARHEPVFVDARVPAGTTVIRFSDLPAFRNSQMIRLTLAGDHCTMIASVASLPTMKWTPPDSTGLSSGAGYALGHLISHDSLERPIALCREAVEAVKKAIESDEKHGAVDWGVDGFAWMLELLTPDGLKGMGRFAPDSNSARPMWDAVMAIRRVERGNAAR